MFHDIDQAILERMRFLEEQDARDRQDGTPRLERLRQIPPETGRFLALMAALAPNGALLEIGTSAGYSALWLALACRAQGRTLTTYEVLTEKAELAHETFRLAGVEDIVMLVHADARERLPGAGDVAFCFLDAEKELYRECYDLAVPRLVDGGLFLADNLISHQDELQPFLDYVQADPRVDAVVVPIGKGVLVCRRI
jgi:predicted O-methyltransferase YrrM